jgi:hypothetical protein
MPDPSPGASFFHQSWPIVGGTLMVQIRTDRVLLGDEYIEIGKVMGEMERLADMLGTPKKPDLEEEKATP